jgi:hypothetical protein
MSTEHQQYSPENQLEIIRQYAAAHNMEIVQEYSDHGRSGQNIAGRDGLNRLMADVEATFGTDTANTLSRGGMLLPKRPWRTNATKTATSNLRSERFSCPSCTTSYASQE